MFVWRKELELGIDVIDKQHQELIRIGNRIYEMVKSHQDGDDNYDDILVVLQELKDYTLYHFNTEEALFLQYHFEESQAHIKDHQKFIDYLDNVNFYAVEANQKAFLNELLRYVVQWVFQHINSTDFKYRDCLLNAMRT